MTCYYSRFTLGLVLLAALTAQGCSKSAKEARVLKRAQESFQDGQYDKARIDYLNVLRSNPANATAVLRLGLRKGHRCGRPRFLSELRNWLPTMSKIGCVWRGSIGPSVKPRKQKKKRSYCYGKSRLMPMRC